MPKNSDSMGAVDRAEIVLEYMAERDVAMSPGLWHANLDMDRSVPFSADTTRRRIHDFLEYGWVERFDIDQGVYRITDAGKQAAEEGVSESEMRDVIGLAGE